jgi:hypothetical protein
MKRYRFRAVVSPDVILVRSLNVPSLPVHSRNLANAAASATEI